MFVHYKLDTRARIEHFFGQSWVETWAGQLRLAESITRDNANKNYNNRYSNRTNTDDGYNFRGRGLLQLTFRDNYNVCTRYLHNQGWLSSDIDFEAQPQLVTDSGVYALLSAVYYWNTKTYPNGFNVTIPAWRNFHLYEIADDETNGNAIIRTIDEDTQQEIDPTQAQRTISVLVNGRRKGLTNRREAHNRIKNSQIFVEFDNQ